MPSFVVTLAGFEIWQGVVLKSIPQGVLVIQDQTVNDVSQYFFSETAGWIIAAIAQPRCMSAGRSAACSSGGATASEERDPILLGFKLIMVPLAAFVTVGHLQPRPRRAVPAAPDRGAPA